jgi:hypothetical protein
MNFTADEQASLKAGGWRINHSIAERDYRRIMKESANEFEVRSFIDDPEDGRGFWELDSKHKTLKDAIEGA